MTRVGMTILAGLLFGCQSIDRFDTKNGSAYCGSIESSQFIWTPPAPIDSPPDEGGFDRRLRLKLTLDTSLLDSTPGTITSDDSDVGPCHPTGHATFESAPLVVTPEVTRDSLSLMTFEDGQVHNVIAWVESTCRGRMLAVISLHNTDRVEVRLLKPAPNNSASPRDAFALFPLDRREAGCGF